jgi:glucosamine-6-phosphate deaminase
LQGYPQIKKIIQEGFNDLAKKEEGTSDTDIIRDVKKLIRRAEATLAVECLGVKRENVISLDLPFYESGKSKKLPLGERDYSILRNYLTKIINPHYIYAAGDLTDPHGTHRICLEALLKVTDEIAFDAEHIFLYRGAWEEWELEMVNSIVPMSPDEITKKRDSIFKHQSQKDRPMFPGNDRR